MLLQRKCDCADLQAGYVMIWMCWGDWYEARFYQGGGGHSEN